MKSLLVILSQTPHRDYSAKETMDFAMSATAFGHQVNVVFVDDGVYQLLQGDSTDTHYKAKQTAKIAKSMSFFDIENTYVCKQSLEQRNIDKSLFTLDFEVIDSSVIRNLIESHSFTVNL